MSEALSRSPLATLVIATYNDSVHLAVALDRARAQTLRDIEIVVVDDCSTKPVEPVVRAAAELDSRISYIRREQNGGVFAALNTGLDAAKGRYIYFGSTNDPIEPEFLQTSIDALESHAEAGMVFFDPGVVRDDTGEFQAFPLHLADEVTYFSPDRLADKLRHRPFHLSSNTVVFRTDALRAVGGCRKEIELYADWFACIVTALRTGAVYVPRVLAYSRIHDDAYSTADRWTTAVRTDYAGKALRAIAAEFPEIGPRLRHSLAVSGFGFGVLVALRDDAAAKSLIGYDSFAMASVRDAWGLMRKLMPDQGRRLVRKIAMAGRKAA